MNHASVWKRRLLVALGVVIGGLLGFAAAMCLIVQWWLL